MRTATVSRRKTVVQSQKTVDQRLREAFPEVNLEEIARHSQTLNAHNLTEKWEATVRAVQFWVDLSSPPLAPQ